MALGQIIRKRREQLHLTLDEVGDKVGFSKPYLSTIETGKVKNPPSDKLLTKLEKILQFEPGLLRHIAHVERLPADIRREYEAAEAEKEHWRQLIRQLVRHKSNIVGLDKFFKETSINIERVESPLKAGRLVPVINKVSAGYPVDFDDFDYPVGVADDYIRCPDIHDPNAFAVRVVGDSMEPKFCEGDIVVFSPAAEVRSGNDCFVRFATPHEATFKRVFFEESGNVRLQPRNENYPPQIVEADRINGIYRALIKYEKL